MSARRLSLVGVLCASLGALGAQKFDSAEQAAQALAQAAKQHDAEALLQVLGPGAEEIVNSGDAVADRFERERFTSAFDKEHDLVKSGHGRLTLEVGDDRWPFPIPLVKSNGRWQFDTAAGKQELLYRRVGRNELQTIQSVLAYVDAQREYYVRNPNGTGLLHYAQRITSTSGGRDGLFWPVKPGEPPSPLGELFAEAQAEGYTPQPGHSIPYHGYYFRVLTAQGPHADGGAYDYLAHGELLGGFALVAYPAEYGSSGVMTFIVNQDGVVFQKDLGPKTLSLARTLKRFDPDKSWQRVEAKPRPGA
jgi:hypothetical protein